jgi:predicted enzyme related to lactoylglutathione lyase
MALVVVHCVTINALDPGALAGFWAALSGGTSREAGNGFVRVDPAEGGVRLLFQKAEQPTPDPGWIHLDCNVPDRAAAVAEISRLGGSVVEHRSDSKGDWIVMADPEGNPFCI